MHKFPAKVRQYNMHPCTFGGSRAAQVLVEILKKEKSKSIRLVGKLFHSYATGLREIWLNIYLEKTKWAILNMWHKAYLEKIKALDVSDKCKSYLSNVVLTLYKRTIRGDFGGLYINDEGDYDESADIS
jgi:hypothetical protein